MWKTWLSFQSSSCSEYSDSEGYSQDVVWSFWYEPLVKEEEPIPRLCVVDEAGAKIETWVWYLHLKSWLSQFPTRRFTETVLMGFGISSAHTEYLGLSHVMKSIWEKHSDSPKMLVECDSYEITKFRTLSMHTAFRLTKFAIAEHLCLMNRTPKTDIRLGGSVGERGLGLNQPLPIVNKFHCITWGGQDGPPLSAIPQDIEESLGCGRRPQKHTKWSLGVSKNRGKHPQNGWFYNGKPY